MFRFEGYGTNHRHFKFIKEMSAEEVASVLEVDISDVQDIVSGNVRLSSEHRKKLYIHFHNTEKLLASDWYTFFDEINVSSDGEHLSTLNFF